MLSLIPLAKIVAISTSVTLLLSTSLQAQGGASSSNPNVWITGALEKVHTDAAPGTGHSLQLSTARNEFESFQVHVRAGVSPIQLNVTVSDFVNVQNTNVKI